jgi:hypothetical protein
MAASNSYWGSTSTGLHRHNSPVIAFKVAEMEELFSKNY